MRLVLARLGGPSRARTVGRQALPDRSIQFYTTLPKRLGRGPLL